MMTIEQIKKENYGQITTQTHLHILTKKRRKTHTLTQYDDVVECQMNKTYNVLNKIWLPSSLTGCYYKRA